MRHCHRKLRRQRGAAMVIALFFFLLCTLVGTLAVTAAATNAGKAAKVREEQQAYLAVRSAAQLVADMVARESFVGEYEIVNRTWTEMTPSGGGMIPVQKREVDFPASGRNVSFVNGETLSGGLYKSDLRELYYDSVVYLGYPMRTVPSAPAILSYTFQVQPDGGEMPPVNITLEFANSSNPQDWVATITAMSSSGSHRMVFIASPTVNENRQSTGSAVIGGKDVEYLKTTTIISWTSWKLDQTELRGT